MLPDNFLRTSQNLAKTNSGQLKFSWVKSTNLDGMSSFHQTDSTENAFLRHYKAVFCSFEDDKFDEKEKSNLQTVHIGDRYKETIIESVPNNVIPPEFFSNAVLNIRCDYVNDIDLNILYNNLSLRKCCIVTDKPFDLSYAPQVKQNLTLVIYDITKDLNIDFIKSLEKLGIKYACAFNRQSQAEETLHERRTSLIDYCNIEEYSLIPDGFDREILNTTGLKYKSNRVILSAGKVFSSNAALIEGLNSEDSNNLSLDIDKIQNKNKFLEDLDYCMIYKDQY